MNIYVGNLSLETTEDDLRQAFAAFGQVRSVNIVKDKVSGTSRGFGFVSMPSKSEAQTAISEMNEKDLDGQTIKVEEGRLKTRPVAEGRRPSGFGGGRGPSGSGRGRGGAGRQGGFRGRGRGMD
jgi:RNA recognition motif-containing protein